MAVTMKSITTVLTAIWTLFSGQLEACVRLGGHSTAPSPENCHKFCPEDYGPVCGSDGQTYKKRCKMDMRSCEISSPITEVHRGPCGSVNQGDQNNEGKTPRKRCGRPCPEDYSPVCGSNGETYDNPCEMRRQSCQNGQRVRTEHDGPCEGGDNTATPGASEPPNTKDCNMACGKDLRPVCGSDGKTHSNPCMMELKSCETGSQITEVHGGECAQKKGKSILQETGSGDACDPDRQCPKDYSPVCGSDDKTYRNECEMRKQTCGTAVELKLESICPLPPKKLGRRTPKKKARRPATMRRQNPRYKNKGADACNQNCDSVYAPMCANGVKYHNECQMRVEECNSGLVFQNIQEGECSGSFGPVFNENIRRTQGFRK